MSDWCLARGYARSFFAELHALQRRWDPLGHPFHARWADGTLSYVELARYAGEYEHVVIAQAAAARRAAEGAPADLAIDLADYADEAAEGIELWSRFRDAVDGATADAPGEHTVHCARARVGDTNRSVDAWLALVYTVALTECRLAAHLRDALAWRYRLRDRAATAYFHLHADRQRRHGHRARAHLELRLSRTIEPELLACVDAAFATYWEMLSAVDANDAALGPITEPASTAC